MVVACDLLLGRALRVCLDVRMKETSAVAHVLQRHTRAVCYLERAVLSNFRSAQIGLEERAHLGITRTAVLEDQEVEIEGENVDRQGNHDETKDAESDVREELHLGHLEVAKLVPEVLDGVESDKRSDEEADPLDTANASDRNTSHHQPQTPLRRERVLLLAMELGPAEDGCEGEAEKHRVEQNEAADGGVRVLAEHCQGDEPDSGPPKVQLLRGEVCQRYADGAEGRVEEAHEGVVQFFRVRLARLELKRSVVSCEVAREADEHLSERRVDIEVEFALEVV